MTEDTEESSVTTALSSTRPVPDWARPGIYQVAPGIHRIPLPMPSDGLVAVNVYAIEDGGRLVLVDGGWAVPEAREALDRALGALDADARAVTRILVTHIHRDHYTLAVQLRKEFGTPISLGAGERPALELLASAAMIPGHRSILVKGGARQLMEQMNAFRGVHHDSEAWEAPDEWLSAGELPLGDRELEVSATPGHTQGHVVFRDRSAQLLFAGDHVLPHITPSIGFEVIPAASPLRDYLASLQMLRSDSDATLLPAHGQHGDSVHERVDQLVTHHAARLGEMFEVVAAHGEATAAEVAAEIGWTHRRRPFSDLDMFNQMLAVSETLAHLTVLVAEGSLHADGDEVLHYSVVSGR